LRLSAHFRRIKLEKNVVYTDKGQSWDRREMSLLIHIGVNVTMSGQVLTNNNNNKLRPMPLYISLFKYTSNAIEVDCMYATALL
jgi:hypothetical protein